MQITGARDEAWHDRLYRQYRRQVMNMLARQVPTPADAEDLTQDTFATAWKSRNKVPDEALPWLHTTARNLAMNLSKRRGTLDRTWAALCREDLSTNGGISTAVTSSDLIRACRALSTSEREAIWYCAAGLSNAEIAAVVKARNADTIRQRLHRARQKLLRAMPDYNTGSLRGPQALSTGEPS